MDKWREILNKRELPSIDENKKRQSIEILKMEIANTEITVKKSNFTHKRNISFYLFKIAFLYCYFCICYFHF